MNDMTLGTVVRGLGFGRFGFGVGSAAVTAWRIASSWACVMVPFVTRPSRIAFSLVLAA